MSGWFSRSSCLIQNELKLSIGLINSDGEHTPRVRFNGIGIVQNTFSVDFRGRLERKGQIDIAR